MSVNRWCRAIGSRMLRRDGTQIRCMRSPPASFSGLRETRASGPGAGREVGLEEGDAEVYSGKRHRSRSNSALPAFALLRPAGRLFPCPSGDATEQPQHQSNPRRLIEHTADRQVRRTVVAGVPPASIRGCNSLLRRRHAFVRLRGGKHVRHFGRTRPVASLPLQSLAGDTPATTDHQSTFATRGTREVFSRVPA